jgi:ribosome-binding factor A
VTHARRESGRLSSIRAIQAGRAPRPTRVAEQLRQEISGIMLSGMKDPRVRLASVSEVVVSADLRSARVRVSAIGSDPERRAVVDGLRHAEGFLRAELGHRLENLKAPPRLHFELDESIAYSVRISSMLRELGADEQAASGTSEDPT